MSRNSLIGIAALVLFSGCEKPAAELKDYGPAYRVENGEPVNVMLTAYSTTLIANGTDKVQLHISIADAEGHQIGSASDSLTIFLDGGGLVQDLRGNTLSMEITSHGTKSAHSRLVNGGCDLVYVAGKEPGKTRIEVRAQGIWPGGHEIHLLPADFKRMKPGTGQLTPSNREIPPMIGADISWLPEFENERGLVYREDGTQVDPVELLNRHGFNFIRLRLFVNPEHENGYSPLGYCGLDSTLRMAHRAKEAGMGLLLNFHYSDYWADPQQQFKPMAWEDLEFEALTDTLREYTARVLRTFREEGVFPEMVQVGNEINHGILWPEGHMGNPDQLATLLKASVEGVREVDDEVPVMMHIALGGQNDEAVFWLDNMMARGVDFDVIGLSYYPRWHGTLDDLNQNLNDLVRRYHKPVNVVEYNNFKKQVHEIVFGLPDGMGTGTCIWEPLGPQSGLFEGNMEATPLIQLYDTLNTTYLGGGP